ncbi:hypothetical protein GCM10028794_03650 [Silanimonas algicola]
MLVAHESEAGARDDKGRMFCVAVRSRNDAYLSGVSDMLALWEDSPTISIELTYPSATFDHEYAVRSSEGDAESFPWLPNLEAVIAPAHQALRAREDDPVISDDGCPNVREPVCTRWQLVEQRHVSKLAVPSGFEVPQLSTSANIDPFRCVIDGK